MTVFQEVTQLMQDEGFGEAIKQWYEMSDEIMAGGIDYDHGPVPLEDYDKMAIEFYKTHVLFWRDQKRQLAKTLENLFLTHGKRVPKEDGAEMMPSDALAEADVYQALAEKLDGYLLALVK